MRSFGRRTFVWSALLGCALAGVSGEAEARSSSTSFSGQRLGRNHSGEEVKVVREVGSPAGYDERLQATAVARMANADPAVVVRGLDGKWHALVTTANAFGGIAAADNTFVRELVPLPSDKGIAASRKNMDRAYVSLALGLDDKEVQITHSSTSRDARFVNVNTRLGPYGLHGPEKASGEDFTLGARTAIELKSTLFERADLRAASAVLFHEATHHADYDLAQRWASAYAGGREFRAGPEFTKWVFRRLRADDAQTVVDVIAKANGSTEARAYIGAFIAAMQVGAYDAAREQLVTYAGGFGRTIPEPVGEIVPAALHRDLEDAYGSLDARGKKEFDAAFAAAKAAAAKSADPRSWIARFEHGAHRRS